ncbi:MAG: sulfotransferase [Phycisphaerales bacterium]
MTDTLLCDLPTALRTGPSAQPDLTHRGSLADQPVFLVGAERSGTTLLRLMLDHHPSLAFQYESEYMVEHVGDDGTLPDPHKVVGHLSTDRIFLSTGFSSDVSGGYVKMAHDWLDQKRNRDNKPIVGATIHKHFDRIPHLWPNARYIHLLRDGRDVARSCVQMGWYGNAYAASDNWLEAMACWDRLCQRVPQEQRLEIRYESLITDPVETLSTICRFLGLPFDQAMFDYVDGSTYSYPDPRLIHQWINKMPEAELGVFEGKVGQELKARGYQLSGQPVVKLSPAAEKWVYRQSNMGRRMFRIKRFGLKLILLETLGRKLKLGRLHDWAVVRMNAIEEMHIK